MASNNNNIRLHSFSCTVKTSNLEISQPDVSYNYVKSIRLLYQLFLPPTSSSNISCNADHYMGNSSSENWSEIKHYLINPAMLGNYLYGNRVIRDKLYTLFNKEVSSTSTKLEQIAKLIELTLKLVRNHFIDTSEIWQYSNYKYAKVMPDIVEDVHISIKPVSKNFATLTITFVVNNTIPHPESMKGRSALYIYEEIENVLDNENAIKTFVHDEELKQFLLKQYAEEIGHYE